MQKDAKCIADLVDLEKCCQTHIFLQNFVLIQPRTSPPKNCKNLLIFPILLTLTPNELRAGSEPAARVEPRHGPRRGLRRRAGAPAHRGPPAKQTFPRVKKTRTHEVFRLWTEIRVVFSYRRISAKNKETQRDSIRRTFGTKS